jgi:uncharacterized protein YjcR
MQPEAINYSVDEFCRQLKEAEGNLSHEMERAVEQKQKIQAELSRLVADRGHSTLLIEAIEQREQQLRTIEFRPPKISGPTVPVAKGNRLIRLGEYCSQFRPFAE